MVIAFDIDGTLFDTKSEIIRSLNQALNNNGFSNIPKNDEDDLIGPSLFELLPNYLEIDREKASHIVGEFRSIYATIVDRSKPFSGVIETLTVLKQREVKLAIATNKPYGQVEALLVANDLLNLFDMICTTSDYANKTMMLEDIKKHFNRDIDFYYVGDTKGDLESSTKAGFSFIGANYGYGKIGSLSKSVIEKFDDVLKITEVSF